jgi:hypothetical protein
VLKNTRYYDPINDFRRRVARRLMRLVFGNHGQPTAEPLPAKGIYRILVCHVSHSLGNTLLLTPLLEELEKSLSGRGNRHPYAQPHRERCIRPLLQRAKHLQDARAWRRPSVSSFSARLQRMRKIRYDLAIDADPLSQTGRLLMLLSNSTYTLGFSSPKKHGEITHPVPLPSHLESKGRRPVYLLRTAMGRDTTAEYPVPDIRLSAGNANRVAMHLPARSPQRHRIARSRHHRHLCQRDRPEVAWAKHGGRVSCRCCKRNIPTTASWRSFRPRARSMLSSKYPAYFLQRFAQTRQRAIRFGRLYQRGLRHHASGLRVGCPDHGYLHRHQLRRMGPLRSGRHVIRRGITVWRPKTWRA